MSWSSLAEAKADAIGAFEQGRIDEALRACEWICQHDPSEWNAWQMRSAIHGMRGDFEQCAAMARRVIELQPSFPGAHSNLGGALHALGRNEEALASLHEASRLAPKDPETRCNLGYVLYKLGDLEAAEAVFAEVACEVPDFAIAHNGLGSVCLSRLQLEAALKHFDRALLLRPNLVDAHANRSKALSALGRRDQAAAAANEALRHDPNHPDACLAYGEVLRRRDQLEDALAVFQRGLSRRPNDASLHCALALTQTAQGRVPEAIETYRHAMALDPHAEHIHGNLLLTLQYSDRFDPREIFAEHQRWGNRFPAAPARPARRSRTKIRLGFVSGDLRSHSVAYFVEPIFEHLDRDRFEIFAYYTGERSGQDAYTDRLRGLATAWREPAGSASEVAEEILGDGIDILIDLAGHTSHNRLDVFARRAAPVQATYLGYPGTTGLIGIDYRITDEHCDPPGVTEHLHSERLLRIPGGSFCYRPPRVAEEVANPPADRNGYVTFGSFNNLAKLSPSTLRAWGAILREAPDSRLLIKNFSLRDGAARQRLRQALKDEGVAEFRLDLMPAQQSTEAHLASYANVDIGLDTFPYNGTTTTCEALWMGVPVVALLGSTHVARVGGALMTGIGLEDLVSQSPAAYVERACRLAEDRAELRELRRSMRARLLAAPLLDGAGFCRRMAAALETIA